MPLLHVRYNLLNNFHEFNPVRPYFKGKQTVKYRQLHSKKMI